MEILLAVFSMMLTVAGGFALDAASNDDDDEDDAPDV
jgi:hypothetical protein